MSSIEGAYNQWAESYDSVVNPTRDMDKKVMQSMLADLSFKKVLELGCGTGKNTAWLASKTDSVTAVDLSSEMLTRAREKTKADNVKFIKADINQDWNFANEKYDLVSFNLVLEHIEYLPPIFEKAARVLKTNGYLFICELHPFKQYAGSKARFEKDNETVIVECYNHHITDYLKARDHGFEIVAIKEWFDEERKDIPRLISFLFRQADRE
jgi:ubiquinone/menaquinone biosynthesis C-methylase UbiE